MIDIEHSLDQFITDLNSEDDVVQIPMRGERRDNECERAIESLATALNSDTDSNELAVSTHTDDALPDLLIRLYHPQQQRRLETIYALAELKDERAIKPLIALFEDEVGEISLTAATVLAAFGSVALEPLLAALASKSVDLRYCAAEALGELGDKRAVVALLIATRDEDQYVRAQAAEALGKLGDYRAVEPLILMLHDEYTDARSKAAEALGLLCDYRAVTPLILALNDKKERVRIEAIHALALLGDSSAIGPLLTLLPDSLYYERIEIIEALGALNDEQAIEPLLQRALHDDEKRVRQESIVALGHLGDERVIEPLKEALTTTTDSFLRSYIIKALGMLGCRYAQHISCLLAVLLPWLSDTSQGLSYYVRASAATALGRFGDIRVLQPLLARLDDDNYYVRGHVALALADIADSRVIPPLIRALSDVHPSVRAMGAEALGKCGDKRAIVPLSDKLNDESGAVRANAAEALGFLGAVQAVPLLALLQSDNTPVAVDKPDWQCRMVKDVACEAIERITMRSETTHNIAGH
ncbi:HEAT repeat domain-containing protein [Dictyobacter formicarum]|uniref:Phycocyanobilin lyase n=1 Tax=Dictyobacter formicarum TaxID=2778368 RepID=A0ABQ3VEI1_9CHLR|nr:HEAT repeat domain-containing protein [Dictyobacter formicarum]GHO84567.1 hypothetical protein KSZ_25730 [Dictyobacter formicarum]